MIRDIPLFSSIWKKQHQGGALEFPPLLFLNQLLALDRSSKNRFFYILEKNIENIYSFINQPIHTQVLTLFFCPHTYIPMISLSCVGGERLFHFLRSFIDGFTAWQESIPFSTVSVVVILIFWQALVICISSSKNSISLSLSS